MLTGEVLKENNPVLNLYKTYLLANNFFGEEYMYDIYKITNNILENSLLTIKG